MKKSFSRAEMKEQRAQFSVNSEIISRVHSVLNFSAMKRRVLMRPGYRYSLAFEDALPPIFNLRVKRAILPSSCFIYYSERKCFIFQARGT